MASTLTLLLCFAPAAHSQAPAGDGSLIRVWGHGHQGQDYILTLLQAWQSGFKKTHPEIRFDDTLYGNASGLGGLYTDVADLALLDREASFIEVDAYEQAKGFTPFRIPVARGSVATPHHAPALKIFVNNANPLAQLSVQQLDGIFDADHRLGDHSYKTWGDLGITGEWAAKPIHIYTYEIQTAEIQFFERVALKGSQKFACCLTLFHAKPGMTVEQQITDALAKDKYGLALATMPTPALKSVALSTAKGPAVLPTPATISDGSYPLARTVYLYANRKPKAPLPPNLAAFLSYIVSPDGQAIAAHTGGYLPLSPELTAQAQESLR